MSSFSFSCVSQLSSTQPLPGNFAATYSNPPAIAKEGVWPHYCKLLALSNYWNARNLKFLMSSFAFIAALTVTLGWNNSMLLPFSFYQPRCVCLQSWSSRSPLSRFWTHSGMFLCTTKADWPKTQKNYFLKAKYWLLPRRSWRGTLQLLRVTRPRKLISLSESPFANGGHIMRSPKITCLSEQVLPAK